MSCKIIEAHQDQKVSETVELLLQPLVQYFQRNPQEDHRPFAESRLYDPAYPSFYRRRIPLRYQQFRHPLHNIENPAQNCLQVSKTFVCHYLPE